MENRKKQYLHDNTPFTKYAITAARKRIRSTDINDDNQNATSTCNKKKEENYKEILESTSTSDHYIPINVSNLNDYEELHFNHLNKEEGLCSENDNISPIYEDLYSSDEELTGLLNKAIKPSNNLKEILDHKTFFESISLQINRSPAELLLMALKYAKSNSLSMKGMSNLFKFMNIILGKLILPETQHTIEKLCTDSDNVALHGVCPNCSKYIGTFKDFNCIIVCENCHLKVDMTKPSNQCFYAIIDPSDALRDYLETNENFYDFIIKERKHEQNYIKDIYDGQLYRKFLQSLKDSDRHAYATTMFNTDGAPVFKSSTYSLWPIYITLNKIPIQNRLRNITTAGLWFGQNKPEMGVFLESFVDVMNKLSTIGILCKIKEEERCIKIYSLVASVDTIVRAPMQGINQFNSNYGCNWCLHEGKYHQGSMRYPFEFPFPKARDHDSTIKHAAEAVETNKNVLGVKTASPLLYLRKFDIIEGFVPDYMHCCLAGVAKQLMEAILKYISVKDMQVIDNLLKKIKSPHQIGRLSRSLKDRRHWKAREFENWLLYYSIPLLSVVLENQRILAHLSLFTESLYICLQMNIPLSELNRANDMLHKFVSEIESIYITKALTYNVHQLLHLCKSVFNWGPLYAHSTFSFEAANHKLLKTIHSAKGVVSQIVKHENIERFTQHLESTIYPNCSAIVSQYCNNLQAPLTKKAFKLNKITYIGKEQIISDRMVEQFHISRNAKEFNKIIFDGCLFLSSTKENERSCNYYVQLFNKQFVKLITFVVDEKTKQELTICQIIKTKCCKYTNFIKEVLGLADIICVETHEIAKTCVFIDTESNQYIIPLPNQLFY